MTNKETISGRSADFQTTHWSVLLAATDATSPKGRAALAELCQNYWYPVYVFMRRRGQPPERAQDLTQELFCRLLEKGAFASVDRNRGRFRSFLRTCAVNLVSREWNREHAVKRGGAQRVVAFDEALAERRYAAEPAISESPEKLFERRWAVSLLERVMERLRKEHAETGKAAQFEVLEVFMSGAKDAVGSYASAAAQLGVSELAARKAASRMRSRFGELLRMEVAQTLTNPAELEEEMNYLRTVLSG